VASAVAESLAPENLAKAHLDHNELHNEAILIQGSVCLNFLDK